MAILEQGAAVDLLGGREGALLQRPVVVKLDLALDLYTLDPLRADARLVQRAVLMQDEPSENADAADHLFSCPNVEFNDATFDEVRVERVSRSAAWIEFEVAAMPDQRITYGELEP